MSAVLGLAAGSKGCQLSALGLFRACQRVAAITRETPTGLRFRLCRKHNEKLGNTVGRLVDVEDLAASEV